MSKFDLKVPDDEDLAFFTKEYANLGELNMKIEDMESSIPDKRTKDYQIWMKKINHLIDLYNKTAKFKVYKKYE